MAQPGVAREPSMEEILASIRRIIENNETENGMPQSPDVSARDAEQDRLVGYDKVAVNEQPASFEDADDDSAAHDDIELTVDRSFGDVEDQAEEPAEDHAPETVATEEPVHTKPSSLADVAARVRAHAESQSAQPSNATSPLMTSRMAGTMSAGRVNSLPENVVAPAPIAEVDDEKASPAQEIAPILSDETGQKVARSFGELAVALNTHASRSLDEIAEEMLRPMLREWLDDNLPTMVERLVREEIERVARGPRS